MPNKTAENILFAQQNLDLEQTHQIVKQALANMDDGELFIENTLSESFSFDDNRLRAANFDISKGFGLRAIVGELTGYAHATELSTDAISRAGATLDAVRKGHAGTMMLAPSQPSRQLYVADNPLDDFSFEEKIQLLEKINEFARKVDNRVRQVSIGLSGEWQVVSVVRADQGPVFDIRPLVRLDVSVVLGVGDRQETGHSGRGGRASYAQWMAPENWQSQVRDAIRQADVNLDSVEAPAGEMDVVLGAGWPGILLHEAVGHGLEGDFNRKKTSAFSDRIGERVAAKGVTVIDDGTIENRRGSLTIDDEGTPSSKTVLIEDGILRGYMQDRLNARLMGMQPTGNGRRESFACQPMPRMTNTYMLGGQHDPQEIISSVKKGIYATAFGGGQVDITSGKFVFSCTESYEIENGKIGRPLKGATLIGTGPETMQRISMIGNDMALDEGIGTCGKDGQGVPVGVGQPSLRIDGLTVGGTAS